MSIDHEPAQVWLASLAIEELLSDHDDGTPFNAHWKFVSENIDGIKFWDFQISRASVEQLTDWFEKCRALNIRIGFEKGRWPLAPDMHEKAVERQIEKRTERRERGDPLPDNDATIEEIIAQIHDDRGGMVEDAPFTDYEAYARAAAGPEIRRLRKIDEAGGLDLVEFIEYDGAVLKNVFAYAFGISQWRMDLPESMRFKEAFPSMDVFVDEVYVRMIEIIREEVPGATHVKIVHLPNVHLWTYRQDVEVETLINGEKVYHNVDFKRLEDRALDLHDLLDALDRHRDIFTGITTDYPLDFYMRPAGGRRYRGFALEAKERGLHLGACINAMTGSDSMAALYRDSLEFAYLLHEHVQPDLYMVQSWFKHPTPEEILVSEDVPRSYMNLVKEIILLAKEKEQAQ